MSTQISEAECLVMEVLWQRQPLSAEDIATELATTQPWELSTVKTLLNRLLNKGAIAADKDGRRFLYRPLLDRRDYVQAESQSLLDRLFGGRIAPLVAHFSEQQRLSKRDIAALKQLLEELDDES